MPPQTEQASTLLHGAAGTAQPVQAAGAPQKARLLFIDNLRILLICMVLVVHLDDTYGAIGSWYYHDPATNMLTGVLLTIPNAIGMASGMGFFFLLAGYFTPGSYDRKGPRSFLRDRLVRLGIPVLIYSLLLDPLVVYIAEGLHGSYWSFYANYLPQVRGVTGPAWFIALLLLFSLVYAAWRGLTRHRTQTTARTGKLPSYRAIFGFIFALGLVTFVVRIWWPAGWIFLPLNVPVGYLPQYMSLYILVSSAQIWHCGTHHHPAMLPDQQPDSENSLRQQDFVKENESLEAKLCTAEILVDLERRSNHAIAGQSMLNMDAQCVNYKIARRSFDHLVS